MLDPQACLPTLDLRSQSDRAATIDQLLRARQDARALLATLARQVDAGHQANWARVDGRPDVFRQVTGQSSAEAAKAQAQRLIEQYDRLLGELGWTNNQAPQGTAHSSPQIAQAPAVVRASGEPVVLRGSFRVGPATIARTG